MIPGRKIGEAFIRVRPDTQGFAKAAQPSMATAGKIGGKVFGGSFLGSFTGTLLSGGIQSAFRAISGVAKDAFAEAREAAKIGRLTTAVIKSTGGAARVTVEQVDNLGESLGELAGVDDEVVQGGLNMLLTFTRVRNELGKGNDIFNQTAAVALDMNSALTNGNVTAESYRGAMLQVGRALNDPIKGMNSLRRAGVTFTDQQKKTIKSLVEQGKITEAQKIILAELRVEFGGAGAAATDEAQKAQVAWSNFKERLGTLVLPMVGKLATIFTQKVLPVIEQRVVPALITFGTWIRDVLVPAVREFGRVAAEKFGKIMDQVRDAWERFRPVAEAIAKLIGPAFAMILENLKKAWDDIRPVLGKLTPILKAIGIIIAVVVGSQVVILIGILVGLSAIIRYVIIPVLKFLLTIAEFVAKKFMRAFELTVSWFQRTFWPALQRVWASVSSFITTKISQIVAFGRRIIELYHSFRDAVDRTRNAVVTKIGEVLDFIRGIPGRIKDGIGNLGSLLYGIGRDIIQGMINGIRDMIGNLVGSVGDAIGSIPGAAKRLLGIGSPSKVFAGFGRDTIRGYIKGFQAEVPDVQRMIDTKFPASVPTTGGGLAVAGAGLTLNLINHGVIGSQRELDNWLVKSVDRLRRERRL